MLILHLVFRIVWFLALAIFFMYTWNVVAPIFALPVLSFVQSLSVCVLIMLVGIIFNMSVNYITNNKKDSQDD